MVNNYDWYLIITTLVLYVVICFLVQVLSEKFHQNHFIMAGIGGVVFIVLFSLIYLLVLRKKIVSVPEKFWFQVSPGKNCCLFQNTPECGNATPEQIRKSCCGYEDVTGYPPGMFIGRPSQWESRTPDSDNKWQSIKCDKDGKKEDVPAYDKPYPYEAVF